MKPILLATDGSPTAAAATSMAVELARALHTPLVAVAVWDPPYTGIGYASLPITVDLSGSAEHALQAIEAVAKQAEEGGVEIERLVCRGFPVDEICRVATECDARLVVLGSHGWGPVRRMLFGSVARGVLNHAPCPVLVVPARLSATQRIPQNQLASGA